MPERLPTRRQHPHRRAALEDLRHQVGDSPDQVLTVVDDQQHVGIRQDRDQSLGRRRPRPQVAALENAVGLQSERREHGRRQRALLGDRGEFDQPHAVAGPVDPWSGRMGGQAGLSGPARPDDRGQPAGPEQVGHPIQFCLTSDEAGQRSPEVGPLRRCRFGVTFGAAQQRKVLLGQLLAGIDTEIVGESSAQRLVGGQRVRGAARRNQRLHQPADEHLVQRMTCAQLLELGDQLHARAQPEIGIDPVAEHGQPLLLPPGLQRGGVRGVVGIAEGFSAPQGERLDQGASRAERIPGAQTLASGRCEVGKDRHVDGGHVHSQSIAGRHLLDDAGIPQRAAEPGHQRLQRITRSGRRAVRPDGFDQFGEVDGPSRVDREPGQQATKSGAGNRDRPVTGPDLQRSEDADLHRSTLAERRGRSVG